MLRATTGPSWGSGPADQAQECGAVRGRSAATPAERREGDATPSGRPVPMPTSWPPIAADRIAREVERHRHRERAPEPGGIRPALAKREHRDVERPVEESLDRHHGDHDGQGGGIPNGTR